MARKYTNRYLDTSRTLKQQDKLTVTFLLAYVSVSCFFSEYMLLQLCAGTMQTPISHKVLRQLAVSRLYGLLSSKSCTVH
jgi:hypothetical protein